MALEGDSDRRVEIVGSDGEYDPVESECSGSSYPAARATVPFVRCLYFAMSWPRFNDFCRGLGAEYTHRKLRWLHCWHLVSPLHLTFLNLQASHA